MNTNSIPSLLPDLIGKHRGVKKFLTLVNPEGDSTSYLQLLKEGVLSKEEYNSYTLEGSSLTTLGTRDFLESYPEYSLRVIPISSPRSALIYLPPLPSSSFRGVF